MMKKIIVDCCEKIVVDEKDLTEGTYRKKGYEFEWEVDSKLKQPSFLASVFLFALAKEKGFWKRYKLQENIICKYTLCPICGEKVWMDAPYNGYWILQGGFKVIEIKNWETEWKDFW